MDFASYSNSPLPSMTIAQGGGYFEGLWITGSGLQTQGMVINSQGPTTIYQLSDEHFGKYSLAINGAANLLVSNWEAEDNQIAGRPDPGVSINLANSSGIYLYNIIGVSSFPPAPDPLIQISASTNVRIWNAFAQGLPSIIQDGNFIPSLQIGSIGDAQIQNANAEGMLISGYISP
jgi:hypothetical protein